VQFVEGASQRRWTSAAIDPSEAQYLRLFVYDHDAPLLTDTERRRAERKAQNAKRYQRRAIITRRTPRTAATEKAHSGFVHRGA
jgi:hypothetical protein